MCFFVGGLQPAAPSGSSERKSAGSFPVPAGNFHNPGGKALNTENVETKASMLLRNGFESDGEVRLLGAKIGGQLLCFGGTFRNPGGCALDAENIETRTNMFLDGGFEADGAVNLQGAKIGGQFRSDGIFHNPGGHVLNAENIKTGTNMLLNGEFEGTVDLRGAKIGGQFRSDGIFHNPGGSALNAENSKIGTDISFRDGFRAAGMVVLDSAHIGRQLDLRGGIFQNELDLEHATACKLADDKHSWPAQNMLFLDGFTYEEITYDSPASWQDRVAWLALQEKFTSGPYEQLARVYREQGDVRSARKVLIRYRRQITSARRAPLQWGPIRVPTTLRSLSPVLLLRRALGFIVGYGQEPRAGRLAPDRPRVLRLGACSIRLRNTSRWSPWKNRTMPRLSRTEQKASLSTRTTARSGMNIRVFTGLSTRLIPLCHL